MAAAAPEDVTAAAGIVSVSTGSAFGDLVTARGDLQYGELLLPATVGSDLTGWRDTPDTAVSDTPRPQAHGSYAGDIWADSAVVTLKYLVPGPPLRSIEAREAALRVVEACLPLDSVERPLVVNDGDTTYRMARVLQRVIPRPWNFAYSKALVCSVQFLAADPRRYALAPTTVPVAIGTSSGGLAYPLVYPLAYGTVVGGTATTINRGSTAAPVVATFTGPLTNPVLASTSGWRMGFRIVLAAGETLVVDTAAGTALLSGVTDRLYTIDPATSPLEACLLPPGASTLSLAATAGTGSASVTYRNAYL